LGIISPGVKYVNRQICCSYQSHSKDGTVTPASKLTEARELELQRSRDFEASIEDEERHRRTARPAPEDKLKSLPLTRERFEE
jgi:hypothetical protein